MDRSFGGNGGYLVTGSTLRKIRRELRLTQSGLARLLATDKNTVARYERGDLPIRRAMARLVLLVAHLGSRGDNYAEYLATNEERQRKGEPRADRKRARTRQRP